MPDRPDAAKRLGLALLDKTKVLGRFPLSGRIVPEFADPTIRELILQPCRIVYRVEEKAKIVGVVRSGTRLEVNCASTMFDNGGHSCRRTQRSRGGAGEIFGNQAVGAGRGEIVTA